MITERLRFSGPAYYRAKSAAIIGRASAEVARRRLRHGPLCPEWNLAAELGTEIMRRQLLAAFAMPIAEARVFLESISVRSSALAKVTISDVFAGDIKGSWITPPAPIAGRTILFLHGGGYAFYPRGFYDNLGAMIAISARCRIFALDYGLTPEHRFPSQLADAAHAYEWLLRSGVDPSHLIVLGDSAGGNLTLSLILSLRDSHRPLPSLAVCLSPATDFEGKGTGAPASSKFDWITQEMAIQWASWFCSEQERCNPLVSPINADLRGLPPIYIQAGGAEILLPSMQIFVTRAKGQGADVVLETWPNMNHDFQALGYDVPQSKEAIDRIGAVIASYVPGFEKHPAGT